MADPTRKLLAIEICGGDSWFSEVSRRFGDELKSSHTDEVARPNACIFGKLATLVLTEGTRCAGRIVLVVLVVLIVLFVLFMLVVMIVFYDYAKAE